MELEGEYIAMEVARAVLSPVAAVSALCAAADTARITSAKRSLCSCRHRTKSFQHSARCEAANTEHNRLSKAHFVQLQTQNEITTAKRTLHSCT